MEIEFLGTGAAQPSKNRNVSSLALKLLDVNNQIWLFDVGEATQHQILRSNIRPRKINKIFISHLHGDHIFGLPGFLASRQFQGSDNEPISDIDIYAPKGLKDFIFSAFKISKTHLAYRINFIELQAAEKIFEDQYFEVYTYPIKHGIEAFGFRIVEKDIIGVLDVDAAKKAGVPFGPMMGQLKAGKTITLDDGQSIDGKKFVGPDIKGRIISIINDSVADISVNQLTYQADYLVHEATFGFGEEAMAKKFNHSTIEQAALVAKKNQVGQLLITHISNRYLAKDLKVMQDQARKIFENTTIAKDLQIISLPTKK